jgi:predicted CxxxxCH...CXXCH cytochrome family protein
MPESRKKRPMRPFLWLPLLAALALAAGCSTANTTNGDASNVNHLDASGNSVPGWVVLPTGGSHSTSATLNYTSVGIGPCAECHGSDLSGGISNVSCYQNPAGCHHGPVAGWVATPPATQQHGVSAKKAPGSSGFASCQICHANDFSGGGSNVSCFSASPCHGVSAPHAPKPWIRSPYTHTSTDPSNASICAQCHFPNSPNNPANHPATPAPAGTPPGCFNSTLCHGEARHPSDWVTTPPDPQPHGIDAKAVPGSATGFAYCKDCHGSGTTPPANFGGGSSGVSCYSASPCHGVNAPHAPAPWRTSAGSTYTHTTTNAGNASICQECHYPGSPNNPPNHPPTPAPPGTPPGCFNSTLCHGEVVAHPVPYNDPSHYSTTAATFPATCSACHDVSAPSTEPAPPCQTCHVAASPLTAVDCTSCHSSPPDGGAPAGAVYPNIAGAHAAHIALNSAGTPISCDTCHNGLGPSLQNLNHYDRANAIPGEDALRVPPGDAVFVATYDAKTGATSFDNSAALNCTNASCHGGQATPNWQTGALVVNDQCTNCHALGTSQGNPQYNSEYSGRHSLHLGLFGNNATTCKYCHNTTTLATTHFTTLSTSAMEGPASATIGGGTTLISGGNYNASTMSCTPSCHGTETW